MQNTRVAIIGAGLTGLTCARNLAGQGVKPVLFDKSRGLGGRLATRRAEGELQFDHGAPYLTPNQDGFRAMLHAAQAADALAPWQVGSDDTVFVGVPGMTGLAKHLAADLEVRRGTHVQHVAQQGKGWIVDWADDREVFDRVVITTPAPQTVNLLPAGHPTADALKDVRMDPCLTLMIALPADLDVPFVSKTAPSAEIAWIAVDSTKPARPNTTCVVAHASTAWSVEHLEKERDEIAELMLPLVLKCLSLSAKTDLPYVSAHRWRYARALQPLGKPFLADDTKMLFIGGDWCLGDSAEDAWTSGRAIAKALMTTA